MPENVNILEVAPVIPVVTIADPNDAVGLARALVEGGVRVIELTLRTENALDALKLIAGEVPEILVGAGTILTPQAANEAVGAGAQFLVSPGVTPTLMKHLLAYDVPLLPGVATVSEIMMVMDHGLTAMKFFPAEPAGGPDYLSAVRGPLPMVRFCPTGGIQASTAGGYLSLPNVSCVGGSWLTPKDAIERQDWARVTELARQSVGLGAAGGSEPGSSC